MTKRPARASRRPLQPPPAVLVMPIWKRALGAAFFILGGGGAAAWGICDVVAWVGALHRGDGVIETENFILGFPLLGAGLCAIGPEFIIPRVLMTWSDALKSRVAGIVLGSVLAGIVLVFLGQLVINATMGFEGYHACEVFGRGRYTSVTWAHADVACRRKELGQ